MNITCDGLADVVHLVFNVLGYEPNYFEDLFLFELGTREISLNCHVITVKGWIIFNNRYARFFYVLLYDTHLGVSQ